MSYFNKCKFLVTVASISLVGCATANEETYRAIPFNTANISTASVAASLSERYSQAEAAECFYIANKAVSSALNSDAYSSNWYGQASTASSFALKEYRLKQAQFAKSAWEAVYISKDSNGATRVPTSKAAMKSFGSEIVDSLMFKDLSKVEAAKIDTCTSPVLDEIDGLTAANNKVAIVK